MELIGTVGDGPCQHLAIVDLPGQNAGAQVPRQGLAGSLLRGVDISQRDRHTRDDLVIPQRLGDRDRLLAAICRLSPVALAPVDHAHGVQCFADAAVRSPISPAMRSCRSSVASACLSSPLNQWISAIVHSAPTTPRQSPSPRNPRSALASHSALHHSVLAAASRRPTRAEPAPATAMSSRVSAIAMASRLMFSAWAHWPVHAPDLAQRQHHFTRFGGTIGSA